MEPKFKVKGKKQLYSCPICKYNFPKDIIDYIALKEFADHLGEWSKKQQMHLSVGARCQPTSWLVPGWMI
jgi:hypothetical protein